MTVKTLMLIAATAFFTLSSGFTLANPTSSTTGNLSSVGAMNTMGNAHTSESSHKQNNESGMNETDELPSFSSLDKNGDGKISRKEYHSWPHRHGGGSHTLPVKQIKKILQAPGTMNHGVLTVDQDRKDLHIIGPDGIRFKPDFELANEFHFQPLARGRALLNADVPLRPSEIQPFIDKLLANGLIFQAFHQHYYQLHPKLFFIHFRGVGYPIQLAHAVANAISATATPLPQKMPSNPKTSLNTQKLAHILGGTAEVGGGGTITVTIPRQNSLMLGGVHAKSETGLQTNVQFQPLGNGKTAVSPDFAMTASEIQSVMRVMRKQGFLVECLYNQETDEFPQLYFSHQWKIGNAYKLARQIRRGLDQTNAVNSDGTDAQ